VTHPSPAAGVPRRRPRTARLLGTAVAALSVLGLQAGSAAAASDPPPFGVSAFTGTVLRPASPDDGPDGPHYADLAGEHPDTAIVDFSIPTQDDGEASPPVKVTRDIRVDIPAGLVPNPAAFPTCTNAQLDEQVNPGLQGLNLPPGTGCPVDSQVGFIDLSVMGKLSILPDPVRLDVQLPVYNMTRGADQVGRFAFLPGQAPGQFLLDADKSRVDIVGGVRPSDNGLFFTIRSPETLPLRRSNLTFWGTPGLGSHDPDRGALSLTIKDGTNTIPIADHEGGNLSVDDKTSTFLTNPTLCAGPLRTRVAVTAYTGEQGSAAFDTPYGALGCDSVPFAPKVSVSSPDPVRANAPTALDVALEVPQSTGTDVRGSAQLKDAVVELPEGFSINPSAAAGLEVCTDEGLGQGTDRAVDCPAASRVGAATIETPVLDSPLKGSVFLGQPQPGDRYRLFVVADGHGVSIRLKGSVQADAKTGRLTATFRDNPQLPFSALRLALSGGPRAILASPTTCGPAKGGADLTPFSSTTPVRLDMSIDVAGCEAAGFSPDFAANVPDARSGKYAPATFAIARSDNQDALSGLRIALPVGMTAKIKGVTRCAAAQIAAQACPEASRIGTVSVQSGVGSAPYPLAGSVYLTDGYKGGAFGTVAIIRAVAGPYDLGNVVVRQALRIDPTTAQVTIDSDPLPQIVEGIPLRLRNLRLDVNRKDFLRNPTSCGPTDVAGDLSAPAGAAVQKTGRVTFADCQALPFRPKIALALGGKGETKTGKHPSLTATITQYESEAGIRSAQVALPKRLALAADNAQALCSVADADANRCPKASIVGTASATTTILEKPLTGPVYFVKGQRTTATGKVVSTLPTLRVALRGQAAIDLKAETAVNHGRLVTTFPAIPDQPLTRFALKIDGGKHGILALTSDLCSSRLKGSARFRSYSAKVAPTRNPAIATSCKSAKR
jgi:hypothetical protein